jgi:hypothetical protein
MPIALRLPRAQEIISVMSCYPGTARQFAEGPLMSQRGPC